LSRDKAGILPDFFSSGLSSGERPGLGPLGLGEDGFWFPVVDIYETEDGFVVEAELPGVQTGDLHITARGNVVAIQGARRITEAGARYHRIERACGAFSRSFELPCAAGGPGMRADLKDGLLTIVIPKEKATRRLEIL
jgi:HSP20 family protein